MYKSKVFSMLLALLSICAMWKPAHSQDAKESPKPADRQFKAFRLDLSINEIADGKKINSRHYSMNVTAKNGNNYEQLKIGSRVPVQSDGKLDYLEIGTAISVELGSQLIDLTGTEGKEWGPTTLNINAELTSFADQDSGKGEPRLIRQVHLAGTSPLITDKPILVASADDPDSKHEFQLVVTATKLTP